MSSRDQTLLALPRVETHNRIGELSSRIVGEKSMNVSRDSFLLASNR